jgi:putative FmdB family regulatory protein
MPLYEYRCESCGHRFEVIQRFSDPPIAVFASCGAGPVVKLLSSPAIQFKGSGWYITDYARKGQDGGDKGGKKDANSAKKDSTSTESTAKTAEGSSSPTSTSSSKE